MNKPQKLRLFVRISRVPFQLASIFIFFVSLFWFLEVDATTGRAAWTVLGLCFVVFALAVIMSLLKYRIAIGVLRNGRRLDATVLRLTRVGSNDDAPARFVLDWKDEEGAFGFSEPDQKSRFEGYEAGAKIIVYKTSKHESWWEKDLLG